jgi:hypothetical protein
MLRVKLERQIAAVMDSQQTSLKLCIMKLSQKYKQQYCDKEGETCQ